MSSVRLPKEITDKIRAANIQAKRRRPVKLSKKAKKLLALVPPEGVFIGNRTLQRRSKLGRSYWKAQKQLVDGGYLSRGKGRGGSVARLTVKA
ncbi:MAG TPA: hypothetical protein VMS96_14720, partial [Terriglobales bacterium]|nr:hypothetical protein [Terriglobales bacterium]